MLRHESKQEYRPMTEISLRSHHHTELVDITAAVQSALPKMDRAEGVLTVYCPHTTAGLIINEHADPDVARDLERRLDGMIPWDDPKDCHNEGNTAAHLKSAMVGNSVSVFVEDGRLRLGTWQGIFFCEFDGPRARSVWLAFA
jgi:secondary thiamine-phosphate synthase enzyme